MYLLYHKKSCKTGKVLGTALRIRRGLGKSATQRPPLIRWGNAVEFPVETILNQPQAILRAGDKLATLNTLADADVRVPAYGRLAGADGVWLGRSRRGFGGLDIIPVENGVSLHPRGIDGEPEFYTKYIPNKREYRVHVFKGEIIRLQGKWLDHPEQNTNRFIKNYGQGYRFRTPDYRLNTERTDMAIKAVEALGLDFGAVDLLIGEDNQTYILEVNTAPKCSPLTARAYLEKFAEYTERAINYDALEALRGNHE